MIRGAWFLRMKIYNQANLDSNKQRWKKKRYGRTQSRRRNT